MSENEVILPGGNVNQVLRIGDTIHRSAKKNQYVHDLLLHLEKCGFSKAPRFLGIDEQGREMLTFIPGVVPGNDYPDIPSYMWSDASLIEIAKLQRQFHDATVGFTSEAMPTNAYPDSTLNEIVCHNDAAPYNIVFSDQHPSALIDFDLASPGPRIWDIVYTLYTTVPLSSFEPTGTDESSTISYSPELHAENRRRRITLFFEHYGIEVPNNLKEWVIERIQAMCATLTKGADDRETAFVKLVEEGHLSHYEQEISFLTLHFDDWSLTKG
ncbi:aminoglycoside phosphotransferase family protein [Paenibacillus sp. GSMTC-2017]|uniref:aminoglycoside phosphotransferase family protein n=1 Tax=Paenibacillus sp. GSMTC-2017 TaxID=2794350 RepID=UPI0018D6963C|nr:aminoglycoside phosphotransferase family protein [Paenibacillus sp. GSMTC-2017]MBH5316267.1 aminoglycoside phosphotransferase family protein [Paenibacillus sp. GSMTC-2017]